jgi:hypothetical protein
MVSVNHNKIFFYGHVQGLNFQEYIERKKFGLVSGIHFSLSDFKNFLIAAYLLIFLV